MNLASIVRWQRCATARLPRGKRLTVVSPPRSLFMSGNTFTISAGIVPMNLRSGLRVGSHRSKEKWQQEMELCLADPKKELHFLTSEGRTVALEEMQRQVTPSQCDCCTTRNSRTTWGSCSLMSAMPSMSFAQSPTSSQPRASQEPRR